ncbi:hypothetical protein EAH87_06715 [Sphingomonas koreensis]|nr:hypothetical protein EAH87_06715 [Sphingomonas koreensis]
MKPTNRYKTKLHIPSPRPSMLGMHEDLLKIDAIVSEGTSWPLSTVEKCIIVSEDHRFFKHIGVDWIGLLRETLRFLQRKRVRGASTIEMQLIRTVSHRYERSIRRKIREIFLSICLQFRYSKLEILRAYLNIAFFGTNLIGLKKSSREVFNKIPEALTLNESLETAAMLIFPKPSVENQKWRVKISERTRQIDLLYGIHEKKLK